MVMLRTTSGQNVELKNYGLVSSEDSDLVNGLEGFFIDVTTESLVNFFRDLAAAQGFTNLKVSASFPEYPAGKDQKITSNYLLPLIVISVALGPSKELGVGRTIIDTVDGVAKGYWQYVNVEIDCHGVTPLESTRWLGWVLSNIQRYKITHLRQKGFKDFKYLGGTAAKGYNPNIGWDIKWRMYPFRIFRDMAYVETSFDVVWIERSASTGLITKINFQGSSYDLDSNDIGDTMEFMLAEELYRDWFDIFF